MFTHNHRSTAGQKKCPIDCIQLIKILQVFKRFSFSVFVFSLRISVIAEVEFLLFLAESNFNCNPSCPVHHIFFNISSSPRSTKVPITVMFSNWNCVCIFKFSSAFLLSHLFHSLSAHHLPHFTHHFSCPICLTVFQLTTYHPSLTISPVPSVPLSFSSPPTNIHSPVQTMQLLTVQFCSSPRFSLCLR